jgi:cell division protein ZapA
VKQVEVSILGQAYVLGCPEGGEALLEAAVASVDKEMTTIREAGKVKARERIAVLAALNVAYQLAERATAPQAAASTSHPAGADTPGPGVDLDALLRRIDDALGDDGQLL